MLYSKAYKGAVLLNGIVPDPTASDYEQIDPAAFSVDQKDTLILSHAETFAFSAMGKGPGSYTFKALIDSLPVTAANKVTSDNNGSVVGADGVIAYDGQQDTTLVLGNTDAKLINPPVLFSVTKFLNVLGKPNSFVLSVSKNRRLYLFSLEGDKSIKLYKFSANVWSLVGAFLTPAGRDFLDTDVVSFKVTNDKIQLMLNDDALWEVERTWNVNLSSADLGTLAKEGPYKFGETVKLTTGTKPGVYTIGFVNQEGNQFVLTQGVTVTDQTAVESSVTTNTTQETLIPILAAVQATGGIKTDVAAANTADKGAAAETSDWGKILTWSAVGLGITAVVVLIVLALRKNND